MPCPSDKEILYPEKVLNSPPAAVTKQKLKKNHGFLQNKKQRAHLMKEKMKGDKEGSLGG